MPENTKAQGSGLSGGLGARFEPLLNYLEIKERGGWGWGSSYDAAMCGIWNGGEGGEIDYAYLKGHYSMLLGLALDLIPPALIGELRNHRA